MTSTCARVMGLKTTGAMADQRTFVKQLINCIINHRINKTYIKSDILPMNCVYCTQYSVPVSGDEFFDRLMHCLVPFLWQSLDVYSYQS